MIVMTVGYVLVRNSRVELEQLIAQNEDQKVVTQLTEKMNDIAEISAQRELAKTRLAFLQRLNKGNSRIEMLFRALSKYIPDNAVLMSLALDHANADSTEIVGQVTALNIAESDKSFAGFYNQLKNSGLFAKISEPDISTRTENGNYLVIFVLNSKLNI